MALNVQTFAQVVSRIATAMQASASASLDFTVGSTLRALAEAQAGVMLWLQAMILQVLTLTRAATSTGSDLDSFNADYNFTRLPATAATGQVTFSRFTATMQALIPVGTGIQTADGSQQFNVTTDATNTAYSASQGGYVIPAGTTGISVPVVAATLGTPGNVRAGSITQLTGGVSYVDTVTNPAAFLNGIDAEADAAFRARFVLYLASLSKGTKAAVAYAVTSLRQGLTLTITEDYDYAGNYAPGTFFVVVDDGTGYPSANLLNNARTAIEAVRPLGITFAVFPPSVVTAAVSVTITNAAGTDHATVVAAVGAALNNAINALPLATNLPYTRLASLIYAVPGVTNATAILLNGATSDVTANQGQKVLAGTITVA